MYASGEGTRCLIWLLRSLWKDKSGETRRTRCEICLHDTLKFLKSPPVSASLEMEIYHNRNLLGDRISVKKFNPV